MTRNDKLIQTFKASIVDFSRYIFKSDVDAILDLQNSNEYKNMVSLAQQMKYAGLKINNKEE